MRKQYWNYIISKFWKIQVIGSELFLPFSFKKLEYIALPKVRIYILHISYII